MGRPDLAVDFGLFNMKAFETIGGDAKMLIKQKLESSVRVTFVLPVEEEAESVHLVGDFNDWDTQATPLTRNRDGEWETKLDLEPGRRYQFRYLVNQQIWHNDPASDGHASNSFGSDNSVVSTVLASRANRIHSDSRARAEPIAASPVRATLRPLSNRGGRTR
jgi:1,4-alpha-glucan branching enzyme